MVYGKAREAYEKLKVKYLSGEKLSSDELEVLRKGKRYFKDGSYQIKA